jgi:transcriptional antiterminator RfaH
MEGSVQWYLVHTKPRQEKSALENLVRQGYECYLPTLLTEKILIRTVTLNAEPLFPRYLFIKLGSGHSSKSWAPIRSTTGVNRLVSFGSEPARVDARLVELLRVNEALHHRQPKRLFNAGDRVQVTSGPFNGVEGIYQMTNGERRAMVLIEIMSKPVPLAVAPAILRKMQ